MASAASRPAALRVTSGPVAVTTGTTPSSRHRISPVPALYRSYPDTGSPKNRAVAPHTNPTPGVRTCRAVNRRHRPSRISPRICSSTDRHNGTPGSMACSSSRWAAGGRVATMAGAKT